jgi:cytochrome c oxidase cbb3-type subunit II
MKMNPAVLIFGSVIVLWASFVAVVLLPTATIKQDPSEIWREPTAREAAGRKIYMANGCVYCHSQYIRPQDWDIGAERLAQIGDYRAQEPALLGSERTGPDLSQEGGEHPDDWHIAHHMNPRNTRPVSLMPRFEYLGMNDIQLVTDYMQGLGGKAADYRVARQKHWKDQALAAFRSGTDRNFAWMHANVPAVWRNMSNPYPPDRADLRRGERIYQVFCIGCHGPVGDGAGPAAQYLKPTPADFTSLRRNLPEGKYVGGLIYYQVMNGITGTAMPYFKKDLESTKIWDVSNYVAKNFIGYADYGVPPVGIPAAYINPRDPNAAYTPGKDYENTRP